MNDYKKRINTQPFGRTRSHSDIRVRETRRPTVMVAQVNQDRIQESIYGIFKRFQYSGIDMEALIYFVLQSFEVTPLNYETLYKEVRAYIIRNFAIHQGSSLRLSEVNMRRLIVCYTVEKDKE